MQCAKQHANSVLYGYYACAYLRTCGSYHRTWRQLKKSMGWWRRSRLDKASMNQTVFDICKFATDACCQVEGTCFYAESELATDDKFVKLRNWRTQLNMKDCKLPELE